MSDEVEVQDPVVQEEKKDEISPLAEDTTPKPDNQVADEIVDLNEDRKTIPKERFDQVWARTKKAEAKAAELEAERQREREERIRLEERLKAQEEAKQQTQQKEMSWEQLENGIAEGKWTRDQAWEYKETMLKQRLERETKTKQEQESKVSRVLREIETYKSLIPNLTVMGSEERQKYEKEFTYLVRTGAPDNYHTQLAAARAAFGDPENIKLRNSTKEKITNKEPFMETHSPQRESSKSKSFKDTLTPWQVHEYERLIKHNVYKDWKEVEDEQKWKPKAISTGRR